MEKSEQADSLNENSNKVLVVFTINDVRNRLGMSPTTQWRERKVGRLGFHRIGGKVIYTQQDLENYLERNKREAFAFQS